MKARHYLGIALAMGIVGAVAVPTGRAISASANSMDLADQSFVQFVNSDTTYTGELVYTHTPLYNENLEESGREYTFTVGQVEGYALMAEIQSANGTFYEIEELFYNPNSPFDGCEGLPVYVAQRLYIEYRDEAFYNLSDGEELSAETVAEYAEEGFKYFGGGAITNQYETVNYTTKSTQTDGIAFDLPNYSPQSDPVDCANVAGCVVMGYYDRFYENLIPNFQSYTVFGPAIIYKSGPAEIYALGTQLSNLMGGRMGTTYSEFQAGMNSYVTGKGYSYTTENMFTNGSFNYTKYKQAVTSGKPVVLFMNTFSMVNNIGENTTYDYISHGYINATHAMVGCGYRTDTYYNASGAQIGTRRYLKVASGTVSYDVGYMSLDWNGNLERAISVTIS